MKEKVLLIGWESADWKIILPLVDEGKLPNLAKLIERGTLGKLSGVVPATPSSSWSSIATGKFPYQHNILTEHNANKANNTILPTNSLQRSVKAIWNILSQQNINTNLIGWPASFPVEAINGVNVSSAFFTVQRNSADDWPNITDSIYPETERDVLKEYRVHTSEIIFDDLINFIPNLKALDLKQDKRIHALIKILAETASVHSITTDLLQRKTNQFTAVHYDGLAKVSQLFMNFHPPKVDFVSDADFHAFSKVVEFFYVFFDIMLGSLLQLTDDNTAVMLVSDKGCPSGKHRHNEPLDEPGAPPEKSEVGMFVFSGNKIKQDVMLYGTNVLDITPTLLHYLNLPVAEDFGGKVLTKAFTDNNAPKIIASWEQVDGKAGLHSNDKEWPLTIRQGNYSDEQLMSIATEQTFLYAESLIDAKLVRDAVPILNKLWLDEPAESRYGNKLIHCYIELKQGNDAATTFERFLDYKKQYAPKAKKAWLVLDKKPQESLTQAEKIRKLKLWKQSRVNLAGMAFMHGWVLKAQGNYIKALAAFSRTDENKVYNKVALISLVAECFVKLKHYRQAIPEFEKLITISAEFSDGYLGLARCYFELDDFIKASEFASRTIQLRYFHPKAHFLLGSCLFRLGNTEQAIRAFEVVIAQAPLFIGAYQRLALLHSEEGKMQDLEKVKYYGQQKQWALQQQQKLEYRTKHGTLNNIIEESKI